jgi:outer membrane protein OmpA-like peptidoglycan-associated protein
MRWFLWPRLLIFVAAASGAPALADAPPAQNVTLDGGASLLVQSITPADAAILLAVTIANPTDRELRLNRGRGLTLTDDGHGVHHLNPPPDNPELLVAAHAQLTGELVFIGPLAASTRELLLAAGTTLAIAPPPAANSTSAERQDGVGLRVGPIIATGTDCAVPVLATNGSDRTIVLNQNRGLVLTDGHGVRAALKAPVENRELVVPAGNRLDGELLFDCHSIDATGALRLTTNRSSDDGAADADAARPRFDLALAVERRPDAAGPAKSRAAVAPIAWSHLSPAPLSPVAASSATSPDGTSSGSSIRPPDPVLRGDAAAPALQRLRAALRARSTERGLRLALPANALFDASPDGLASGADPLLRQLGELIAVAQMREVVVTVHPDPASTSDGHQTVARRRAQAVAAWLEKHAPQPRPRVVAKTAAAAKRDAPQPAATPAAAGEAWVDVILRRDYLVPNSRSPASPSPGKM